MGRAGEVNRGITPLGGHTDGWKVRIGPRHLNGDGHPVGAGDYGGRPVSSLEAETVMPTTELEQP